MVFGMNVSFTTIGSSSFMCNLDRKPSCDACRMTFHGLQLLPGRTTAEKSSVWKPLCFFMAVGAFVTL